MDTEKDKDHPVSRHRGPFSLPFSFHSSSRRQSVIDPPEILPTCEERDNYPVFNPNDPRHNPHLSQTWGRRESQASSSDSQRQSHRGPTHALRSIHRARSGLLALKSSLFHRSNRPNTSIDDTDVSRRGLSSMSTQEDLAFGVDLYRTNALHHPNDHAVGMEALMRAAAFPPLASIASAPESFDSSKYTMMDPDGSSYPVGIHHCRSTASQIPNNLESLNERPDKNAAENTVDPFTAFDPPTEGEMKDAFNAQSEDIILTQEPQTHPLSNERVPVFDESLEITMYDDGSIYCNQWKNTWVKAGDFPNFAHQHRWMDGISESLSSGDQDVLSTVPSNKPSIRGLNSLQSEAFVTQERLQVIHDLPDFENAQSRDERSTEVSAEVRIAFPNLYQELIEQWKRERDSADNVNGSPAISGNAGKNSRASFVNLSESTNGQQCDAIHTLAGAGDAHLIPTYISAGLQPGACPGRAMQVYEQQNFESYPSEFHEPNVPAAVSIEDLIQDLFGSGQSTPVTDAQRSGSSHSFGLHMSRSNGAVESTGSDLQRPQNLVPWVSRQQASAGEPYSFSPAWRLAGSPISPCDSDCTYADMTSPSSALWSPLDSPIDEEILFSNYLRDEYYMTDGKTSSFYPDQDDQSAKVESSLVASDGRIHSGPGLDRTSSTRMPNRTRLTSTCVRPQPFSNIMRSMTDRGESESSDGFYRQQFVQPGQHSL